MRTPIGHEHLVWQERQVPKPRASAWARRFSESRGSKCSWASFTKASGPPKLGFSGSSGLPRLPTSKEGQVARHARHSVHLARSS